MMQIHDLKKTVWLTCLVDNNRRFYGKFYLFSLKVGEYFFPSLKVNEMHLNRSIPSDDRVMTIALDPQTRMLSKQLQEMEGSDLEFTEIETNEIIRMKVKNMTTWLTLTGRGEKTYQPGEQLCSLQVEEKEIQKLTVEFPDSSWEVPEARVYDLSDELELVLMDALAANLNCRLVW